MDSFVYITLKACQFNRFIGYLLQPGLKSVLMKIGHKPVFVCVCVCVCFRFDYLRPSQQLWSCQDGQFTLPQFVSWARLTKQVTSNLLKYYPRLVTYNNPKGEIIS